MIALIQRVSQAQVRVREELVGAIERGTLALIGVQRADTIASAERLLERLLAYRIFPDAEGRMNESLRSVGGGLLLVPQFTLAADTHKGTRAGFSSAAEKSLRISQRSPGSPISSHRAGRTSRSRLSGSPARRSRARH